MLLSWLGWGGMTEKRECGAIIKLGDCQIKAVTGKKQGAGLFFVPEFEIVGSYS